MTRSIFNFSEDDVVSVCLSGVDKTNKEWCAREIMKYDTPKYEHLLSSKNIMKYMYQDRYLKNKKIKSKIDNDYLIRQPKGALTILDDQNNFIGFILSKPIPKKSSISEIVYALSDKYWRRGIGHSVLRKMIQENFQFNGKELEQFNATARPKNVSSWSILKKVGFEPVLAEVSIDFENKGYNLLPLDNLLNYCKKLKEFINKLSYIGDIVAEKLYSQENDKTFTF
ncbi:7899_t:CDS:2, partial [Gigaspora margarita]